MLEGIATASTTATRNTLRLVWVQIGYNTAAPQVIAHACIENHNCVQPPALLGSQEVKGYEMFVGEAPTVLNIELQACVGAPVFYVCHTGCAKPFNPSAGDNEWSGSTASGGIATQTITAVMQTLVLKGAQLQTHAPPFCIPHRLRVPTT